MNKSTFRTYSLLIFVILLLIYSCAKENNPLVPDDSDKYFWVYFNNDSVKISFSDLPKISADGEEAVQLNHFVDTTLVHPFMDKNGLSYDSRTLYSYQIAGEDGFSAYTNRGYPNNIWEHLTIGHVIVSSRQVIFPDDRIDLPGAYNVKIARHIYIHRKFDLEFADSVNIVELRNISSVQVINQDGISEQAVPLKDVVMSKINDPESYNYNILSLDNFGPTTDMSWEEFQTGYWLLSSEKTFFSETTLVGGSYKLKALEKILVK
ncbi:MAG: hypothetical protein R6W68_04670 [Ignavibacteriaceae bacterium]